MKTNINTIIRTTRTYLLKETNYYGFQQKKHVIVHTWRFVTIRTTFRGATSDSRFLPSQAHTSRSRPESGRKAIGRETQVWSVDGCCQISIHGSIFNQTSSVYYFEKRTNIFYVLVYVFLYLRCCIMLLGPV